MVAEIKKWGWVENPNKIMKHDYYQIKDNIKFKLSFFQRTNEWFVYKEDKVIYKGEVEKDISEIIQVLPDIHYIINCK